MDVFENPWRGSGLPPDVLPDVPWPSDDASGPVGLLSRCPAHGATPLAELTGFGCRVWAKDERGRMGLGSFKALGAACVIARHAVETGAGDFATALRGETYATASAGNHGMSVAAGARIFGAEAVVYLPETAPAGFEARLRAKGARVVREGAIYEDSMAAAERDARSGGWTLLSDSSWPGQVELPRLLMEGYLVMAQEAAQALPEPPTQIFLQAGVGGMAAACAAHFRRVWGAAPRICVVEPAFAPALIESVRAGRPVAAQGPVSCMGRLDCKEPSLIALKGLSRDADAFAVITEAEAGGILDALAAQGMATTESGAAGIAALAASGLGQEERALCIVSEGLEE